MTSNSRQTRMAASTDAKTSEAADMTRPPKTFMDRWVEPPLRAPAPSFMDYPHLSIERHGVLENMAPLGTNPSSKLKKSANAKPESIRRLAFTSRGDASVSAATTPREASTPEPAVHSSRRRSDSRKMEDADYIPKTPVGQTSGRKSIVRSSIPRQSQPPQASPFSLTNSPVKQEHELEKIDRVIFEACREALQEGRMPTAYALRTLYNDHRSNPRIVSIIESVYMRQANADQMAEFQSLMGYKKREGRKGDKAKAYWDLHDNSTYTTPSNLFTPVNFNSPPKRNAQDSMAPDLALPRSPRKDAPSGPVHVSKKHKSNNHHRSSAEVNGSSKMNNGSRSRGRSNSNSSSSSLSSLDEEILGGPYSPSSAEATANQATVQAHQTRAAASHAGFSATASANTPSTGISISISNSNSTRTSTSTSNSTGISKQQLGTVGGDSNLHTRASSRTSNQAQPMASSQHNKALGPKLHAWNTVNPIGAAAAPATSPSSAHTHAAPVPVPPASVANHNNMPAYHSDSSSSVIPPSNLPTQASHSANLRSLKKAASPIVRNPDDNERTLRLKRRAREITENTSRIHESFDRHQASTKEAESESSETGDSIAVTNQKIKSSQILRFRSGQASKKINDESDDLSSPTLLSFQTDLAPGSLPNSRAGTPSTLSRPSRKVKSGPRMKTSPMKKKAGPSAGIPRASGERNSPAGNGSFPHGQDENDDYCSSCGGNGDLVCCDGCTRSFHFKCVDPPMSENQLPDNWFCNACNVSRNPRVTDCHGLFGSLLTMMQKKNPSAFHLPKDIREYFEGVRTGSEGEYEDGPIVTTKSKRGAGYEDVPDYLKLKDTKGNWILCHECHKGAGNGNPIIPCSFCGLHWHLDCLDPPMANPPPPGKLWRCPCHVDDLLAKLPGLLGPAHRFRKIKGASVDKPAFARGFRNNGHIEVELVESDNEEEGFFDQVEFGKVYKLPEEGIKLDFISRIHRQVGRRNFAQSPETRNMATTRGPVPMGRYSILEQQAALNIAQFAQQGPIYGQSGDAQVLIDALMTAAPPEVVIMIAQADTSKVISGRAGQREKQALIAMRALIDQSLKNIDDMEAMAIDHEESTAKDKEMEDDVEMML